MSTLNETTELVISSIDPVELDKTRALAKVMDLDEMAGRVHHSLGRLLRNDLSLWAPESAQLKFEIWEQMTAERRERYDKHWAKYGKLYQGKDMHADDASHELMVAILKKIKDTK